MDHIFPKRVRTKARPIKARKSLSHSLQDKFKLLDLFSQKITRTYNGADRYRTRPGAAVTSLLVVCCLAFSLFRLNVMINRGSPTISKSSFMKDLGLSGPFYPFEYGFDISFGLG